MESIYPPEQYKSSPHIALQQYFEEYFSILHQATNKFTISTEDSTIEDTELLNIKDEMDVDIDLKTLRELNSTCSINNLTCDIENQSKFPMNIEDLESTRYNCGAKLDDPFIINTNPSELKVIQKKRKLEQIRDVIDILNVNKRLFYKPLDFPQIETLPDLTEGADFIISMTLFKPFSVIFSKKHATHKNTSALIKFSQELLLLGRNTLDQVKDAIVCASDKGVCREVENTSVDLSQFKREAQERSVSGFIFIDGTIYNDTRSPNAIDYSVPIMEWAKTRNIELNTTSMVDVKLSTLKPRLGYPYLYVHQGDCEHIFTFTDCRLLQKNDCLHSSLYPHLNYHVKYPNRYCFFCTINAANWICMDSDRLPQKQLLLCTNCCNSYNYINNEKVGNFKLYPYYENEL